MHETVSISSGYQLESADNENSGTYIWISSDGRLVSDWCHSGLDWFPPAGLYTHSNQVDEQHQHHQAGRDQQQVIVARCKNTIVNLH